MRRTILPITFAATALAAVLTALTASTPAAAARAEAPWCAIMQTDRDNVVTDCSFWTFEACVPFVIGGNRGFCQQNPAYEGPPPRKKTYRSRH
jgi:hypothetical protein